MNPPTYTDGRSELVIAYRRSIGISKLGMSKRIEMAPRSYERIENGERPIPPGFIDTLERVLVEFDQDVQRIIDANDKLVAANGPQVMTLHVSSEPRDEWNRAVIGRAAIESVNPIVPMNQNDIRNTVAADPDQLETVSL